MLLPKLQEMKASPFRRGWNI